MTSETPALDERTQKMRDALIKVKDPVLGRTLDDLKTLLEIAFEGETLKLRVAMSTPSDESRAALKARLEEVAKAEGAASLEIEWEVRVPTRITTGEDPLPDVKNVILVMSGKGGVGKSTVATNLALGLRKLGTRVGLFDADIYGPSLPTMFGIEGRPVSDDGKHILPLQRFGVKLMSVGFLLEHEKQAVIWRGPRLHGALKQLVEDVRWGALDFLVVDLPPGTGDVALSIAQKMRITGVVMVTTPQEVALQDVYKGVTLCQQLNMPILGVVENMSYFEDPAGNRHELFGSGGGEKIAEMCEAPLMAQVPIDQALREWGDKGTPVVQSAPDSPSGSALMKMVETLADTVAKLHFERGGGEKAPTTERRKHLPIMR